MTSHPGDISIKEFNIETLHSNFEHQEARYQGEVVNITSKYFKCIMRGFVTKKYYQLCYESCLQVSTH